MVKGIGDKLIFSYPGLGKAMAKYKPCDYFQRVMIPVSRIRRGVVICYFSLRFLIYGTIIKRKSALKKGNMILNS